MRRPIRILTAVAALAIVAAACGDDSPASSSTSAPGETTTTTQAQSNATTSPASSTPAGPGAGLDELAARYEMTPLKVTYRLGEGENETTLVLAQDPTATPPIESITVVESDSKIIISDGTTIFCDGSSGGACFQLPGATGEGLADTLLGPFNTWLKAAELDPAGFGTLISDPEPITVAGRDGTCFTYEPTIAPEADTDLVRQCVDGELGFALLLQTSRTGDDTIETVMELLDFAAPTAADFEPTGPVTTSP